MLSKEQEELKKINILKVAKYFLENGGTMKEVELATGIPSSTVERYLESDEIIKTLGKESFDIIQNKKIQNKKEGLIKGGKQYAANNEFIKDELGKFVGSKKR